MNNDIDISTLESLNDFQNFIDTHDDIEYPNDLKRNYYKVYQKIVRKGYCKLLKYKKYFYNKYPDTTVEWQKFINENKIKSPVDFENRFNGAYNKFRSNEGWRTGITYFGGYVSIRNKYKLFQSPEDFQMFIDNNKIESAGIFRKFHPGEYNKLQKLGFGDKVNYFGKPKNVSCLERVVETFLTEERYEFDFQKKFSWLVYVEPLRLDFYIPELNVAIECQGRQHYEPVDIFGGADGFNTQVLRDAQKYQLCNNNNITIIYFPDKDIREELISKTIYFNNTVRTLNELKDRLNSFKSL